MIFTWSFWAFHDIPGLRKHGSSCSAMGLVQRLTEEKNILKNYQNRIKISENILNTLTSKQQHLASLNINDFTG